MIYFCCWAFLASVPNAGLDPEPRTCTHPGVSVPRVSLPNTFAHRSLKDVNRDGVNVLYNTSYLGEARFDQGFSFSPSCQDKILKICDDLRLFNISDEYQQLIKRDDRLQGDAALSDCTSLSRLPPCSSPSLIGSLMQRKLVDLSPDHSRQVPSSASSTTWRERLRKTTGRGLFRKLTSRRGACTRTTFPCTCRRFWACRSSLRGWLTRSYTHT